MDKATTPMPAPFRGPESLSESGICGGWLETRQDQHQACAQEDGKARDGEKMKSKIRCAGTKGNEQSGSKVRVLARTPMKSIACDQSGRACCLGKAHKKCFHSSRFARRYRRALWRARSKLRSESVRG